MIVKRDENEKNLLHVDHPEVTGSFVMKKPTFGVKLELERVKGAMIGPFPTPEGEVTAEYCALVQVGFEKVPEGFSVSHIVSQKLLEGLYSVVASYWNSFRDKEEG